VDGVQGQLGQDDHKTPSQPVGGYGGVCLSSQTTLEAEIRKNVVSGSLGKKCLSDSISMEKIGLVEHTYYPSSSSSPGRPGPKARPYVQNDQNRGMAQTIEFLPHKNEALSLNPSTSNK
jgi:hypothetical protein